MGQVLHGCATTTEAVRRAIQHSQESLRQLAGRYGINPKTVAKWKKRTTVVARTTRHPGYALSQTTRKRIEEIFGWMKQGAGLRQTRHRGLERVGWTFTLTAAYNLVRLPALLRPVG